MEGSLAVHIGLCVLPILYNFLIGHKLDITSFLCALPIVYNGLIAWGWDKNSSIIAVSVTYYFLAAVARFLL